MKINIYRRDECHQARGLCVVIDVMRAFTSAAYAFAAGANEITLVAKTEDALNLYHTDNNLILMGEHDGQLITGFHYGNSPSQLQNLDLLGRSMVQRTTAGTQGVLACGHVDKIMIASFVVAAATVQRILEIAPAQVSLIVTGMHNGDEDLALAEYLQAKLLQQPVDLTVLLERVRQSPEGQACLDPNLTTYPSADLELALQIDRFKFAMEIEQTHGQFVAKKIVMK